MPVLTMASDISRTILSLTWLWNLFQLFQPMGGVLDMPLYLTAVVGMGRETGAGRGGSALGASVETRANSMTRGCPPRPPPGPRPRAGRVGRAAGGGSRPGGKRLGRARGDAGHLDDRGLGAPPAARSAAPGRRCA